jgi:L-lysine exporter family protein LysE/ArgO
MGSFINGLLLGLAFVMPVGTQNIFIIRSAIDSSLKRSLLTALFVSLMDISLAASCFFGLGGIIQNHEKIQFFLQVIGGLYLLKIARDLFVSTIQEINLIGSRQTALQILKTAFVITWLNPQAIIDGTILLGSVRSSLSHEAVTSFVLGLFSSSLIWFFGTSVILNHLKNKFSIKALQNINKICAVILAFFGIKLLIILL